MHKARVIILKSIKHGESDLLLQTLDSNGNRLHFLAKGALKSKKRFGGGMLEPTHYLDVLYKETKSASEGEPLYILLEAKMIRDFHGLRADYDRLSMALSFLTLVNRLTRSGSVGAKEVFDLLGHALSACEKCDSPQELKLQFQAKLLYSQGVLEHIDELAPLVSTSLKDCGQLKIPREQMRSLQNQLDHFTQELL